MQSHLRGLSLEKEELACLHIRPRLQPIEVDAARKIRAVELHSICSGSLHIIHQRCHFPAQDIIHLDNSQLTMENWIFVEGLKGLG